ncbi:uncharacterized protein BO97DRAFT_411455 [Aspergillus homomorphus CBS 101889]|uniref:Uncharacterized protein n=1 Tax=Aspergillus homomorphus (strain CBS 101889) TaxID=1450537 RepID=A0A395I7T8_ASPHC|nr:hypothetical protein BO97DRAFT_411455 [Aspergillus homomorphus CBS 101889]RAL15313.1 hypothetical protein BO97DRAFT_411455 [Aspergillus homomorphus CBS 101889]
MVSVNIHRADDDNSRLEFKQTQEAGVAHSEQEVDPSKETTPTPVSQDSPSLRGVQLIVLLSCLFLEILPLDLVWTIFTRPVGQQLQWYPSCDSHRPSRRSSGYWLVPNNI